MIVDRTHRGWIVAVVLLTAIAAAIYAAAVRKMPNGPSGGSAVGLAFGIAGSALMVFAGLLGARKKRPAWRLGAVQFWLKGHVWLGLLAFALILFHAGFRLGGTLTTVLMILFALEVASGIFGLVLQRVLPRMLLARVPRETIFEQIDDKIALLAEEADRRVERASGPLDVEPALAAAGAARSHRGHGHGGAPDLALPGSESLRAAHLEEIRPFLRAKKAAGALASEADAQARFREMRIQMPPALHDVLLELEDLCRERREYEVQRTIHRWLHGWLWVHVPVSTALLALAAFHAAMALRF
jgi:hypothetical protein